MATDTSFLPTTSTTAADNSIIAETLAQTECEGESLTTPTQDRHVDTAANGKQKKRKKQKKRAAANIYPRTDTGNAELIRDLFKNRLRYDHAQGRWNIWNEALHRWHEDTTGEVRAFAIQAARHRFSKSDFDDDSDKRKAETAWAIQSENRTRIDAALEIAKGLFPLADRGDRWDADPWLFGVANGVVNLKTGKLRNERREDYITKHSPVKFDPLATCQRFMRFLDEIFNGDTALVEYMQKAIGYALTGSVREQCLLCLYGLGANGKTTFSEIVRFIFGEYAANLLFSALEMTNRNTNDLVALFGARLVTAAETNEGTRLNEARIKALTGSDPVTARRLYHEAFTFQPTHKLILAFNHKPIIADDSEGMWRRVRLVPFTRQFSGAEQDKNLLDKLKAEAPGILAWAVQGCLRWQTEGLGTPPAVSKATAEYREESDHIGEFIEDRCIIDTDQTATSSELWQAYQNWTEWNEETPLSRRSFGDRLKSRGLSAGRKGHASAWTWRGIGLRATKKVVLHTPAVPISDNSLTEAS